MRISLNYRHFESDANPFHYLEKGFEELNRAVDLCEKNGIHVILDLHAVQGCQNSHWHSDNPRGASLFWDQVQYQDRFVRDYHLTTKKPSFRWTFFDKLRALLQNGPKKSRSSNPERGWLLRLFALEYCCATIRKALRA